MWWRLEVERNHAPSPTSMQLGTATGIAIGHCMALQRRSGLQQVRNRKCEIPRKGNARKRNWYFTIHHKYWCQYMLYYSIEA